MIRRTLKPHPLASAFEPVRRAALGLLEVEESTSYGTPALKVKGKLFARLREDGALLVIRTDFDSREAMLRTQPEIFCLIDHYRDYPAVLVRLSAVRQPHLRELLADSWHTVAPKALVARADAAAMPGRPPRSPARRRKTP